MNFLELLKENFLKLISIDSPSKKERKISDFCWQFLKKKGWKVSQDKFFNVHAFKNLYQDSILLTSHLDTITSIGKRKIKIKGNKIFTDRTGILGADDKAGVALIFSLVEIFEKLNLKENFEILLTTQEEIGLEGAKNFDFSKINSKKGLVLDKAGRAGKISLKEAYYLKLDVEIFGKEAHSGSAPEKGINVLKILNKALNKIFRLKMGKDFSINFGVFQGGKKRNIVPGYLLLEGEMRAFDFEKIMKNYFLIKKIFELSAQLEKGKAKIKKEILNKGVSFSPKDKWVKEVLKAFEKEKIKVEIENKLGISEASIYNQKGIRAFKIAVGSGNHHSPFEFWDLKEGEKILKVLLNILNPN